MVHVHRSGGKASDAANPDRDGRDGRSDRYRPDHEPFPTGWKCHRHRERSRRTGRQERPIDPRLLPSARRVTALANAIDPFSKPFLEQIKLGGEATGIAIKPIRISNNKELESAFAAMERDRPDAVIVQPSLPSKRAAELALQHRLPAVSVPRWFADEGGLMSYSAIYADLFQKAAAYVDKILKGAQPADLPVEQPTRFQLVINMKTDKALGLEVPPSLLARADEVIE